jgi:eukaryotic-like serine/threonine-protein kinase
MAGTSLGKYQLIAELGRGGMADVFLAVARGKAGLGFSKLVVIKRLREHLANDEDFVAMLVDEARIAARLNHPNVVQMLEIDEVGGEYFLAMEYLDGQPLRRILQRTEAITGFTKQMQYAVISDVLSGLHHAHELTDYDGTPLKVVHRDVTPHNVFITYDGQAKVVDFGIAKAVGRASETRHGIIKGKVPYMAPEQAAGQVVDRRADIFSVGVMLWEIAVGKRLWQDVKEIDILRALIRGNIPSSPREADPSISPELDAICKKALAFKIEDRYATAADFQTDLDKVIVANGGRPAARDVGKVVSDAFADKREETKAIIEAQLAKLRDTSGDSFRPVKIPSTQRSSTTDAFGADDEISVSISNEPTEENIPSSELAALRLDAPTTPPPEGTLASPTPAPRRNRIVLLAALALGSLLVIGVALAAGGSSTSTTVATATATASASSSAAPTVPTTSASAAPSASSEQNQITASFRADPPEARFSIDDAGVLANPFTGHFPRDSAKHSVRIFAQGYTTKIEEVTFDDDQSLQLSLARDMSKPKKH